MAWAKGAVPKGSERSSVVGKPSAGVSWDGSSKRWIAQTEEQLALVAEFRGRQLRFRACSTSCGQVEATTLAVPAEVEALGLRWTVLGLPGGERLLHGVGAAGASGRQFQLLVAAAKNRVESVGVLFADWTVEEHAFAATSVGEALVEKVLRVDRFDAGHRVLTGVVQSDLSLCGRPALLAPRLLVAEDLKFHGAKLQRLSLAERRGASRIAVRAISAAQVASVEQLSGVLRAVGASSGRRAPSSLTDSDPRSEWAEARGGDGRGEFVVFEVAHGVSLASIDLLIRGRVEESQGKVGPRRAWLATSKEVFGLEFEQDGWEHPGQWYRAEFELPVDSSCVALVLEDAYGDRADVKVTLAEVRGTSPEANVALEQLVDALSVAGAAGDAAEYWLVHRGRGGAEAIAKAFSRLTGPARERAWRVLTSGHCRWTAPGLARIVTSPAARDRERAASVLRRCVAFRREPLRQHFEALAAAERLVGLSELASLEPALAARLALDDLATASREANRALRNVLSRASRDQAATPVLRDSLAEVGATAEYTLSVLRSLSDPIARFEPEASRAALGTMAQAVGFREKYLLIEPVGRLLGSGRSPAVEKLSQFLVRVSMDPDPYLRARATEYLPASPLFVEVLLERIVDASPRVRQAAVARSAVFDSARARDLTVQASLVDAWPFVRLAAVRALALGPKSESVDRALWRVQQEDSSIEVRSASIRALASRGAAHWSGELLALLQQTAEPAAVRAAAAAALGSLCFQAGVEPLMDAALALANSNPTAVSQAIGRAALRAVVQLDPPHLDKRLAPLLSPDVPGPLRQFVRTAMEPGASCEKHAQ